MVNLVIETQDPLAGITTTGEITTSVRKASKLTRGPTIFEIKTQQIRERLKRQ